MTGTSSLTSAHEDCPFVSVVMPTYNRSSFLDQTLPPLFAQTYPTDGYEIILVDDGSTDDTVSRAGGLAKAWPGEFRIVQQQNKGPGSARNTGLLESRGEFTAFIDSDCVADTDWLKSMVEEFERTGAAGIGGTIINVADPDTWVSRYLVASDEYRHRIRNGEVDYLITPNVAFRRADALAVGGFESRARNAEDVDISFKLKDAGYKLIVADRSRVTHHGVPATLGMLFRTFYRYGLGSFHLSDDWKGRRSPPVELIRHLGGAILSPFLALQLTPRVGAVQAACFVPLIVIKHGAFITGLVVGVIKGRPAS